jgi:hypothetical protein
MDKAWIELNITDECWSGDVSFRRQRVNGEYTDKYILEVEATADWPPSLGVPFRLTIPKDVVAKMMYGFFRGMILESDTINILDNPHEYELIRLNNEK